MKNKLPLLLVLSLSAFVVDATAAPSTVGPAPTATPTVKRVTNLKKMAKLAVKNAAAVPGETRNLEATLTLGSGDTAIVGAPVAFVVEGKNGTTVPGNAIQVGSAITNAQGKAIVAYKLPELAQGAYRLKATFAGDDATMAATAEGNLGMIKGITEIVLGDLSYGQYKNEPGKMATVMIEVKRKADGKALAKRLQIDVDGKKWEIGGGTSTASFIPLDTSKSSWNVKVQFDGDDANQASTGQRSYTKPN